MTDYETKLEELTHRAEKYLEVTKEDFMKSQVNSRENINLFTEWFFESRELFEEFFDERDRNFSEFIGSDISGNGFTLASKFSRLYPLFKILKRKTLKIYNTSLIDSNLTNKNANPMIKNIILGHLNSQINKGTSIQNSIKRASDLKTLEEIYRNYDEWNKETSTILNKSFTSNYQMHYNQFIKNEYLGNVYTEKNSFEEIRNKLNDIIPRKIEILDYIKSNLIEIPIDKILPYEHSSTDKIKHERINPIMYEVVNNTHNTIPKCDYAIITALEEDEMEKILPMINIEGTIKNDKHLIEYGSLKSNNLKKIVFASQQATGMIDASILATELIIRFTPKFLIMAGVLGGKPKEINIGDVVVATKVFTIDKGKISSLGFKKELESSNFESAHITKFIRNKKQICRFIEDSDQTRKRVVDIHFGPIGCVRQVIDLEGYFEEIIIKEDRKAIALEMESYGVKRACDLINNGETIPLIIKAAMDNTVDKLNDAKTYAAWNSAMFVRYILENDLI